jgi:hypothetical protein
MALAIITPEEVSNGKRWFRFDIGSNRYFRFAVGKRDVKHRHGIALLAEPKWVSPMQGPVADAAMGRGRFGLADDVFDREARCVQMMSYRTDRMEGPAISNIVSAGAMVPVNGLPPIAFARGEREGVLVRPMRYSQPIVSQAMFLGGLFDMLPKLLPGLGQIVQQIAPALAGSGSARGGGAEAGPVGDILGKLAAPETIKLITQLLGQITGGAQPQTIAPGFTTPDVRASSLLRSRPMARAYSSDGYSQAQVLPFAALIPMLAPLLGQVLNPQTVQSVLDAPTKHTQTIINGLTDVLKLGIAAKEQELQHLRALNPGVDDPALDQLLMSAMQSVTQKDGSIPYRRTERVRLKFDGIKSMPIFGETRVLFSHGATLRFPAGVEVPMGRSGNPVRLASPILQLHVKDAETLKVLLRKTFKPGPITDSGPLAVTPELTADECAALAPGKDYFVALTLLWKTKDKATVGSTMQTRIQLVGAAIFDRIDSDGAIIDLDNPVRYRDYWHRFWAGRFEDDAKRYTVEVLYYLAAAPDGQATNARLETVTKLSSREGSLHSVTGRLKSGMEFAPAQLNRLLPLLDPGAEPLSADDLAALSHSDFAGRFNQAARQELSFRGGAGESFALWAYPAMRLATLVLAVPAGVDANGQVTELNEKQLRLPVPAALHLLGTRSR